MELALIAGITIAVLLFCWTCCCCGSGIAWVKSAAGLHVTKGSFTEETPTKVRVGVVGCGISGLAVVRAMKARGINVTAFDSAPEVGGVWLSNYSGFGLQVPKQLFEFPDFPMKNVPWAEFPTGAQVQAYIMAFTANYQLRASLRLETRVHKVEQNPGGRGWLLSFDTADGKTKTEAFDFVVMW
jgi:cation diffusion facilitator CzcD-associated flavoprotein CzcO